MTRLTDVGVFGDRGTVGKLLLRPITMRLVFESVRVSEIKYRNSVNYTVCTKVSFTPRNRVF